MDPNRPTRAELATLSPRRGLQMPLVGVACLSFGFLVFLITRHCVVVDDLAAWLTLYAAHAALIAAGSLKVLRDSTDRHPRRQLDRTDGLFAATLIATLGVAVAAQFIPQPAVLDTCPFYTGGGLFASFALFKSQAFLNWPWLWAVVGVIASMMLIEWVRDDVRRHFRWKRLRG